MSTAYTTGEFIARARQIHGDRYGYDLVEYANSRIKVKIICPVHGVFEQEPSSHLRGRGCIICAGSKKSTTDIFITKARQIHGDRYGYDLVEYVNIDTKVKIKCPEHGVFEQIPYSHLQCHGCLWCSGKNQYSTDIFIDKANKTHGHKYDYSLTEYVNAHIKVKIKCPEHGVFEQIPYSHLQCHGCPECIRFVSKQEIDLLDYIKSIYKGEIVTNTRKVISPYELDIYLPDIHKAFEYNGMYWHTEGLTKPVGYHQMKNDLCAHRGINLMHIWEHDWLENNRFMKEVIKREIV